MPSSNPPGGYPPYDNGWPGSDPTQPPSTPQPEGQPPTPPYNPQTGQPMASPYAPQTGQPAMPAYGQQNEQSPSPYGASGEGQTSPYGAPPHTNMPEQPYAPYPGYGAPVGAPPSQPLYPPPGPPPYGGMPTAPVVPPVPQRKSRRKLWITIGIIAAVVLLACVGVGGLFAYVAVQAAQPLTAAENFCIDLKKQDYTTAYGMLSSAYKGRVAQDQFIQASKLHDQVDGTVTACGLPQGRANTNFSFDLNQNKTTFNVDVTRKHLVSGPITMVKENGAWKVDSLDATLQGTDLGPLQVAGQFCNAIVAQDFTTAYGYLSSGLQGKATQKDLEGAFANDSQSKITGCTPSLTTYTVGSSDTTATLDTSIAVAVTNSSGTQVVDVPVTLTFVKETGIWKIDGIDIHQS